MTEINERKTALDIYADIKKGIPSQTALLNMESYAAKAGTGTIPKRSRSFITRLVYGTLENYIYIDYIISEFTGKPVSKLKPFIADVLEMSVFQLLFAENVPAHAVVNEAVRLVQASPQRGLKGFVNGVLRNIARSKDALPEITGNEVKVLSVRYSVPEFIVKIISDSLDNLASTGSANLLDVPDGPATFASTGSAHMLTVPDSPATFASTGSANLLDVPDGPDTFASTGSANPLTVPDDPDAFASTGSENLLTVPDSPDAFASTGSAHPLTEPVEVSVPTQKEVNDGTEDVLKGLRKRRPLTIRCNTSLVTPHKLKELLDKEGVTVGEGDILPEYAFTISRYDSIAALQSFKDGLFYVQDAGSILSGEASAFKTGEKVLDMCGAPGGKAIGAALAGALVDTGDVSEAKVSLIRENITRLKLENVTAKVRDACVFDPGLEKKYDAVICDVPCSGIGIIGRKPDIALNLSEEKIDSLAALQRKILETAVRYVKPGGRLIYSTCTVNNRENAQNGRWAETLGLEPLFEKQWLPSYDGETDGFYTKIFKKT